MPTEIESIAILPFVVEKAIENGQMWTGEIPPGETDAYTIPFWTSSEDDSGYHLTSCFNGENVIGSVLADTEVAYAIAVRTVVMTD